MLVLIEFVCTRILARSHQDVPHLDPRVKAVKVWYMLRCCLVLHQCHQYVIADYRDQTGHIERLHAQRIIHRAVPSLCFAAKCSVLYPQLFAHAFTLFMS